MVEEWQNANGWPRCFAPKRSWSATLKSGPSGSTSHEAILFWLINLSGTVSYASFPRIRDLDEGAS